MRLLTGLIATVALSLGSSQAAQAFYLPHFDAPETKVFLEDLARIHLPPVTVLKAPVRVGGRYGTGNETIERALQDASDRQVIAISNTELATTQEGHDALGQCAKSALNGVAADYKQALGTATVTGNDPVWPTFDVDFKAGISGCLAARFPDTPKVVIDETSGYVGDQAAQYAQEALNADSAAAVFIDWMNLTAEDVALETEPVDVPTPSPPHDGGSGTQPDDGSSFPWLLIVGLVAVVVAGGIALRQSRTG